MFKKIVVLSSLVCISMLGLAGCSNQDAEYKIATLTEENSRLARQVQVLKATLDSLNAHNKAVDHSLKSLDMK
ncbi:MAG: hypothetical protein IJM92_03320 [Fibrobacter sp.]|uniref:hypothetical protein n=1 Tax=Fibrobacter sp. TaxID=35828 RepID=UPI0025BCB413|nr:hypothetical protein [Fibrobacter sp.]MBQ7078696.1 hypothetical protein [Fibrobacter sp.]